MLHGEAITGRRGGIVAPAFQGTMCLFEMEIKAMSFAGRVREQLRWTFALMVVAICFAAIPDIGKAQEATASAPEAAVETNADGTRVIGEAKGTFMRAVGGNRQAQVELATKFLLPAVMALLVLIVAYLFASFAGDTVASTLSSRLDETLGKFFGKITKTIILLMAVLGVLSYFDVETTSFAALLAAAGFAIGMALQGTLSNFAAGVMLLVFRPFKVGDYIKVAGTEGKVDAIALFTTSLNTGDNRHIIVPNGSVFGATIENLSYNYSRRVDVVVGTSYLADLKHTRQVLRSVVSDIEDALPEPGPQVYLSELNSSSVDWICRVWCHPADFWAVKERLTEQAKLALDRQGIGIPFPQLDLHVITPGSKMSAAA
jgi:small conductance mechanosensitive channel